jgi:hypothetical protein
MYKRLRILFFSLSILCSSVGFSQTPQQEEKLVRIAKEVWVGATLHSSGFGVNFNVAKFKTYKYKSLINIELLNYRHNKEYKIYGAPDENAKKYAFGKLNSLYLLRFGIGRRKVVIEKLREKGIQLAINWSTGLSLGLAKPIYLEVLKYDVFDNLTGISSERYDPEVHQFHDIYGRGRWSRGLSETRIHPGGYFKAGLEFDYSVTREVINSIEIGMAVDALYFPVEIMAKNNAKHFFPILYLNISIGNKFY